MLEIELGRVFRFESGPFWRANRSRGPIFASAFSKRQGDTTARLEIVRVRKIIVQTLEIYSGDYGRKIRCYEVTTFF